MFDIKNCIEKMDKAIDAYKRDLSKLRAGRANPELITGLKIPAYGSDQPLAQLASVTVESATILAVKPWDKKLIPAIERAIHSSELGLNPVTAGDVVRVPFPSLTEERRKEIVKIVKTHAEQAKVGLRAIRKDANTELKIFEKSISEDEFKRLQDKIQETTDKYTKMIDTITNEKETELMKL
jgi:ribosome recycling factor